MLCQRAWRISAVNTPAGRWRQRWLFRLACRRYSPFCNLRLEAKRFSRTLETHVRVLDNEMNDETADKSQVGASHCHRNAGLRHGTFARVQTRCAVPEAGAPRCIFPVG